MDVGGTLAAPGEGGNAGMAAMSGMLLPQPLEALQARPVPFRWDLEKPGNIAESRVIYQPPECQGADFALADVLVPIDPGTERLHRIVQMEGLEQSDAQHPLELPERLVVSAIAGDVVPGGEHVERIQADGAYGGTQQSFPHLAQISEHPPQSAALAGRRLQEHDAVSLVRGERPI